MKYIGLLALLGLLGSYFFPQFYFDKRATEGINTRHVSEEQDKSKPMRETKTTYNTSDLVESTPKEVDNNQSPTTMPKLCTDILAYQIRFFFPPHYTHEVDIYNTLAPVTKSWAITHLGVLDQYKNPCCLANSII